MSPPCWSPQPRQHRCAASTALRLELDGGIVSLIGPNGAGKTNFLEALYFALTGRSFRTGDRRDMIPFGGPLARAEAQVRGEDGIERTLMASVSRTEGRRHLLDGNPADPATLARHRPPVAVFSPDRLALVKGPPGERRAHLDGFVAARRPSRSELRRRYGQTLAQRNALIARVNAGTGEAGELDAWDSSLAEIAAALIAARAEAVEELAPSFAAAAEELGLGAGATLEYAPRAAGTAADLRTGLAERRDADLRLGRSSWGPHLDDLKLLAPGGRSLRRYGSQGEQRAALLALIFAEREALMEARRVTPAAAPRRRDERARPRSPRAPRRTPRPRRPDVDHRRLGRLGAGGGQGERGADAGRRGGRRRDRRGGVRGPGG